MIRIATFNMENLFTRPTAMSGTTDEFGRQALEDFGELNFIVAKDVYSTADKARLIDMGVDGIISDRPDLLRTAAATKGIPLPTPAPVSP